MKIEATELQGLMMELEHEKQSEERHKDFSEKKKISVTVRLDENTVENLDLLAERYGYVRAKFAKILMERAIEDCMKILSTMGAIHVHTIEKEKE